MLLPASVTPVQLTAVPLTMDVMSVQVAPLSSEPYSTSVPPSAPLSVALTVCAAVCVMPSDALPPVSADSAMALTVWVGAVLSMVTLRALLAALVRPPVADVTWA